jgi:hypothetical protein
MSRQGPTFLIVCRIDHRNSYDQGPIDSTTRPFYTWYSGKTLSELEQKLYGPVIGVQLMF